MGALVTLSQQGLALPASLYQKVVVAPSLVSRVLAAAISPYLHVALLHTFDR